MIRASTMIRPPTVHDVPRIGQIINSHAELGRMLFKSHAQLYESLRDFAVYCEPGFRVSGFGVREKTEAAELGFRGSGFGVREKAQTEEEAAQAAALHPKPETRNPKPDLPPK